MSKVLVMLPGHMYRIVECEKEQLTYEDLRALIDGWVCCALRIDKAKFIDGGVLDLIKHDIVCYVDEEGYMKQLPLTWNRPTDNHPLVGPVVWCQIETVWTDEGPDQAIHCLNDYTLNIIISSLKKNHWIEDVMDFTGDMDDVMPGGGTAEA